MSAPVAPDAPQASSKSTTINLRVRPEARDLIDLAAKAAGKSRTDFLLDAARQEAEAVLLDRRFFSVAPERLEEFDRALQAPAEVNPQLHALLSTAAPWER